MIDYSKITPEMAEDLPPDQWLEWVNYEPPVPSPSEYHLGSNEGRCGFLSSYFWVGEDVLFEAVNHAWNSLSEPRKLKTIYIGMWAGTGGSGKWALAKMLRHALEEALSYDGEPPWEQPFDDIHVLHQAATDYFSADWAHYNRTIQKYADILNGEPGRHQVHNALVIPGPWPGLNDTAALTSELSRTGRCAANNETTRAQPLIQVPNDAQ